MESAMVSKRTLTPASLDAFRKENLWDALAQDCWWRCCLAGRSGGNIAGSEIEIKLSYGLFSALSIVVRQGPMA